MSPLSREHKDKIGKANKGKPAWNKGKRCPKISKALTGKRIPLETRRKMSETHKRIGTGKWMLGRKLSEETRRKMGDARRGEGGSNWQGGITTYKRKLFLNARRRVQKRGADGSHTEKEWDDMKKHYGNMCLCCKKVEPEIKLTEDHIIPLSRGGSDYIENLQPLCQRCNSIKNVKQTNYKEGG